MAHQSWKRSGLGLPGSTESASERTLYSNEYGQGAGWWIQHQCDVLVARAQKRLGLLRVGGGRSRVAVIAVPTMRPLSFTIDRAVPTRLPVRRILSESNSEQYSTGFPRINELDFPSVLDARLSFAASSWTPG